MNCNAGLFIARSKNGNFHAIFCNYIFISAEIIQLFKNYLESFFVNILYD